MQHKSCAIAFAVLALMIPFDRNKHTVVQGKRLLANSYLVNFSTPINAWWLAKFERILQLPSAKNVSAQRDVSVVQHFSLDRLPSLEYQCKQWCGALAAAVYVPLHNGSIHSEGSEVWHKRNLTDALAYVKELHQRVSNAGCRVDMAVYTENLPKTNDWYSYPANALRNMALDIARTELVLLLDADFLVAPKAFGDQLHNRSNPEPFNKLQKLLNDGLQLLVLPAFNSMVDASSSDAQKFLDGDKASLAKAVTAEEIQPFQAAFHRDTNYTNWWLANDVYTVKFGGFGKKYKMPGEYEPYVMGVRSKLPSYDERFRGYNYNKLSYLWYLHMVGFKYSVHPWAFVVHMPHEEQHRRRQQMSNDNDKYKMMHRMWYHELPGRFMSGEYQPVLGKHTFNVSTRAVYKAGTKH